MMQGQAADRPVYEILKRKKALWDLYTLDGERIQNESYSHLKDPTPDHLCLEPFVSDYLVDNGLRVDYPDGKKFAVCLTHDVDDIYPPLKHSALSALYSASRLDYGDMARHLLWKARGQSPYMDFESIMKIEEEYGATSTFFFMATEKDVSRFRYHIEDMEGSIGELSDRGFDVGLHGGYYSYADPAAISREKHRLEKVLNKKITGYRNHYLMFRIPDSWEYLAQCGFRYDATIGNNRLIGFKNGMCHAFRPFNTLTGSEIDIIELPMVLGDFTLLGALSPNKAWEVAKSLIDRVEADNGVATLLWHSDVFNASFRKDWARLYVKILDYCRSKNAWIASGRDVSEWIRKTY
jgi:peptidoglycan/xylan/chitin deacetylase (PgdA/CDA1 family)